MLQSYLGTSAVLEWRYSFSQAEMLLADNIPEKARGSYLALKAVIKTHINKVYDDKGYPHNIASYALKTILFYEVERLEESYWNQDGGIYEKFFWVLFNSLHKKVEENYCPHYWIETLNLFDEMVEEDFTFLKDRLAKIKAEPIKYMTSEWLEWNRYMRQNCCDLCFHPGQKKREVYGEDFEPLFCRCNCSLKQKRDDQVYQKVSYDDVAVQVY